MDRPEAYPITYGVLGLLAYWGPLSGYDLKQLFDHVLSAMWSAAHSQIYNELKRMKGLGWVEMEREEQESRPDRKVYSITPAGRAALESWQQQPPAVLQLRDELLLKMMFGSFAPPEAISENIRASIALHEQRLLQYRQTTQHLPVRDQPRQASGRPNPYASQEEEDIYFRLVSRFAINFEQTYLNWLYEAMEVLEEQNEE
ncbi:PadR family transcriptional regulator [Dictyobacter aurantiacus]|uniref:PadR family transcriptional regulator n=1 Tax=Dictyobacter aurantiacus TaxID=1936993 RepID=A0A401ZJ84_9CHLR|nr:PadR family transcriptional regulator [Dictyobacter aurantiacus]GCE06917.1 PadR family transcriptional regulator [Dictyobacter aurantiacus]